jgi:ferric-dicitrate binding protein FerR (iron transport regulator)
MKPGDLFEDINKKVHVNHTVHPEIFSAWKNHEFVFENTSLAELAKMFKENFNITLSFESRELAERRISGSFHAENEDELLNVIAQLLYINYKYNKEKNIYFFD